MNAIKIIKEDKRMKHLVLNISANESANLISKDIAQELKKGINNLKANFYDLQTGGVNYQSMKRSKDFEDYKTITKRLSSFDLDKLITKEAKLAFWINIYNSLVVHGIIELNIQKSVKEVSSFFEKIAYDIGGYTFSLDDIEHGILRGNKKKHLLSRKPFAEGDDRKKFMIEKVDPRIHFALVCGSKSCPPIGVYEEEKIDQQLDLVSAGFINSDEVIIEKDRKKLRLSKIFKWYEGDFGGKKELVDFIIRYRNDVEDKAFLKQNASKLHLTYTDYDWSLNLS
jgi:hypothetical protein